MKYLILLVLVVTSCAPVYVPNIRNSPMFTKGGEFQGSVHMGNGFDAQAAVSVSNHIGLMGNFSYADRKSVDADNPDDYHRHKFFEGGIGYFGNEGNMFYEIFAGYGQGEGSSYDSYVFFTSQSSKATGKYQRYFFQPAFGLNKKTMNVSFVPRIAFVDFTEFSDEFTNTSVAVDEAPTIFFEPAVVGRVNMMNNNMFFTFQTGVSISTAGERYFDHRPFQLSMGLGFRIGGMKPEKKLGSTTE